MKLVSFYKIQVSYYFAFSRAIAYNPLGKCDANDAIITAFWYEKDLVFPCHGNQNWKLRPLNYIKIDETSLSLVLLSLLLQVNAKNKSDFH